MKKIILFALLLSASSVFATTDTATYSYDNQGRLISVSYTNGTTINYTYDSEGNRTNEQVSCSGTGC